ncbi:MAG: MFS transporter [Sphingopyxis macrogoltabida]|uniref:MFS transporter n=1 Tax=Sphingopyxis macrogoltabida TaxID=33050 RepID=A0A2W5L5I2_SPHMC|nr:MAG: MFS transporter [Sphingopyxis macrogoltabida]
MRSSELTADASPVAPAQTPPTEASESYLPMRATVTTLVVLTLINVLNFLDRQLPFILAESIKRDLGLSDTQLGLLGGFAFAVCYSTMALPLGRLADRWSPKAVLGGCILVWSTMTAAGGLARNFAQLAVARVGVAVGEAGCTPAAHALISRRIAPERRGLALGLFSMGVPVGTMLGLVLGGWINDHASWRVALFGAGGAGLVFVLLLLFLVPDARHARTAEPTPPLAATVRHLFASPAFRALFLAISLSGAAVYATLSFSAPYLIRVHGLTTAQVGLYLGLIQGIGGVVGSYLGGRAFDRAMANGRRHTLRAPALSMIFAAPAAALCWFAPNTTIAVLCFVPILMAYVFFIPASFGMAHIIAGTGRQAVASSVLMIGVGLLGASVGPLVVGMASDMLRPQLGTASLQWALLFVAVANFLAGLAFLAADRRFGAQAA